VAKFMANNRNHYWDLIDDEDMPANVFKALKQSNFMPYLTYWNRKGSEQVGVTLHALSNLYGIDFELYSPDSGLIPFFILTSFNTVTLTQPVRLQFINARKFTLFIADGTPKTTLKAQFRKVNP